VGRRAPTEPVPATTNPDPRARRRHGPPRPRTACPGRVRHLGEWSGL